MKENFIVFFSWQSDIRDNTTTIRANIEQACDKISKKLSIKIETDEATRNESGFVDIPQTVFQKIGMCDIFICDITPIQVSGDKLLPNPNVLIELGYAIRCVGVNRIICIHDTNKGDIKNLPFDINKNRITPYSMDLYEPIKVIIERYEELLKESKKNDFDEHDREIYCQLNRICHEDLLFDSLNFTVENLKTNKFYYRLWDNLVYSIRKTENSYINPEIRQFAHKLADSISAFNDTCSFKFHDTMLHQWRYFDGQEDNLSQDAIDDILQSQMYGFPKFEELRNGNHDEYIKRENELIDSLLDQSKEIREAYIVYRMAVKEKLLI